MTQGPGLVLSLFPGIGLLDRGFDAAGYCVVRGPDLIFGGDIRDFTPPPGHFEGIIGGPPCQQFSRANRTAVPKLGGAMLDEFLRCVAAAAPQWFLIENVTGVPDVESRGYAVQRLNLNARECGLAQNRNRTFQFGSRDGVGLVIDRGPSTLEPSHPCCMASEGTRAGKRSWPEFCRLQGLPENFDLPSFTLLAKYRAVGNGVPVPMARVVAIAIQRRRDTAAARVCVCNCGRRIHGKQLAATAACRKRLERRRRDAAGVTSPGPDTPGPSQTLKDLFYGQKTNV